MVHFIELMMAGGKQRPPGNDLRPEGLALLDHLSYGFLLDRHASEEHIVGLRNIVIVQSFNVHIDEFLVPIPGKHRSDREQAEGRETRLLGDELQSMFEAPEGFGEDRIDEENLHDAPIRERRLTFAV